MKVRLFSNFGDSPELLRLLARQTPELNHDKYKSLQFVNDHKYEAAVCFNWPVEKLRTPTNKNIGFLMEPPELENLDLSKLKQIGVYYTPVFEHGKLLGSRFRHTVMKMLLHTPPIQNNNGPSQKQIRMSMIVSSKAQTPFQIKRVAIYRALLATSLPIEFYGRDLMRGSDARIKGSLPSLDKQGGLVRYAMSLAFENSQCPECISEKLYDCLISNCIPITNAPGVSKYLIPNSYAYLDFAQSVEKIVEQITRLHSMTQQQIAGFDSPVAAMKKEVLGGSLSLAEAIYQAMKQL